MHKMSDHTGFTMVELLIVVAIIVVLIAIIIGKFDPFTRKGEAYDAERGIHARQIYKAINDYLWSGQYPPSDFPSQGEKKWICDNDLTGSACVTTVNGVDLSFLVTQEYLELIPEDPAFANAKSTGLQLTMEGDYYTVSSAFKGIYEPPPDPVARWKLDETILGTALEEIGGYDGVHTNMNPGNPSADVPYVHIENTGSLEFDNNDDYIVAADDDTFDLTNALSITAWVKGRATATWGGSNDADTILRKGDDCAPDLLVWAFAITSQGNPTLVLDGCEGAANAYEADDPPLALDTWYHVAATWDGSTVLLYVNGALQISPVSHAGPIPIDSKPVYIGGRNTTAGTDRFDGWIDDVRLYDQALTAEQVRWIAQGLF